MAFDQLELGLQPFLIKPLTGAVLPPYTALPRNGAMVVIFDDVLADGGNPDDPTYPGKVTPDTVRIVTGYPPTEPFELRVVPDRNHGDIVGGTFHSTRVILDMTVSQVESQQVNVPVNAVGLPSSIDVNQPNVALRIPTSSTRRRRSSTSSRT